MPFRRLHERPRRPPGRPRHDRSRYMDTVAEAENGNSHLPPTSISRTARRPQNDCDSSTRNFLPIEHEFDSRYFDRVFINYASIKGWGCQRRFGKTRGKHTQYYWMRYRTVHPRTYIGELQCHQRGVKERNGTTAHLKAPQKAAFRIKLDYLELSVGGACQGHRAILAHCSSVQKVSIIAS